MNYFLNLIKGAFCAAILFLPMACGDDTTSAEDTFDRSEMLENYANNLIIPSYTALQSSINTLSSSAATFANNPNSNSLGLVQDALKQARITWQEVNLFQFGPAESSTLRSSLNTYPTDVDLINSNIEMGNYVLGTLANTPAGGFPTLDYLLHGVGENTENILAMYTTDANATNRLAYLVDNVEFIKGKADQTLNGWLTSGDGYLNEFLNPDNSGTDVGSSTGILVNSLVLQYERFTRDGKLAIPAGIRSAGVTRPKATEAYYAGYSTELLLANMLAIQRFFFGQSVSNQKVLGLSDYLEDIDAPSVSDEIEAELEQAIIAVRGLNDPLSDQIGTDLDKVLTTFTELQEVVVLMKVDMSSLLGITITFQDNDGD